MQTGVFFIQNTGDLRIRADNTDAARSIVLETEPVELYHNNVKRLETSSVGVGTQDLDVDGHTTVVIMLMLLVFRLAIVTTFIYLIINA